MTEDQAQQIKFYSQILELRGNPAWMALLDDVKVLYDDFAENWTELPDNSDALREARSRQIAYKYLLNILDVYDKRIQAIQEEVINSDLSDHIQDSDYDADIIDGE
jgi:hypothetical protein